MFFPSGLHLGAPREGEDRGIKAMICVALLLRPTEDFLALDQMYCRVLQSFPEVQALTIVLCMQGGSIWHDMT